MYSTPDDPARDDLDDARLLDLDVEKESPFLRAQKRVPARRSPLPKKTATRLLWAALAIVVAALAAVGANLLYHYGEHSSRFGLESSDDIQTAGLSNVTRGQVMEVMGGDIGRNVFFIPLDQRQKQLEQIPWVESASVMRFAPNRIKIEIHERTPVAFARVGSKVLLTDAGGTLMDLSTKKKYSFPVIIGMNPGEPLSTRSARMKIYNELVRELDSGGGNYSKDLSEVDLTDPEDVKVLANNPEGEVLVHLGSSDYLDRFKMNHDQRARPSRLARASAPSVSESGTCGLGQCRSNRSTSGKRRRTRLSLVDRSRSFGAKCVVQTLVVTNTSSRLMPEARTPSPTSRSFS